MVLYNEQHLMIISVISTTQVLVTFHGNRGCEHYLSNGRVRVGAYSSLLGLGQLPNRKPFVMENIGTYPNRT